MLSCGDYKFDVYVWWHDSAYSDKQNMSRDAIRNTPHFLSYLGPGIKSIEKSHSFSVDSHHKLDLVLIQARYSPSNTPISRVVKRHGRDIVMYM